MIGNNKNFECSECGFDTLPVVTVNYQDWDYCPVCGSDLVEFDPTAQGQEEEDSEEEDDEMTTIPINGKSDSSEDSDSQSDTEDSESDAQTEEEDASETSQNDEEELIEEELDRLRNLYGPDDEDEEDA